MLSNNFPPSAVDVQISHTNLDFLPDDLGEYWTQDFESVFMEHCGFHIFPEVINDLSLNGYVSFAGNNLTEIPEGALAHQSIFELSFAKNPIQTLPTSFAKTQVSYLYLDETNITTLPDWADEKFFENRWIYAVNTPLCEQLLTASSFSSLSSSFEDVEISTQAAVEGLICDEIVWPGYELVPMVYYEISRSPEL
jgi:Leucine-rich repeat (LRR) protein